MLLWDNADVAVFQIILSKWVVWQAKKMQLLSRGFDFTRQLFV